MLALHFHLGQHFAKTVDYADRASEMALHRHAYRETISHTRRALQLIRNQPERNESLAQEITLHIRLGTSLVAI